MTIKTLFATVAGVAILAAPAAAQRSPRMTQPVPSVEIAPYAGYMLFDDFIEGPLGTSLGGGNGPVYGLQMAFPLTANIALVGNVGYSDSNLRVGIPLVGGIDFGEHNALMYDGGLQLTVPGRVSPFVQAGVGGMRQEVTVAGLSTDATGFVYSLGGGVDIGITPNVGLRLMAKDYAGKFDFREATFIDVDGGTMHNVALSAGLRFHF